MTPPLVVIDADVLGRQRTGDETYVENLLRRLPALGGDDFRFAAITRHPELVPEGVEPIELARRLAGAADGLVGAAAAPPAAARARALPARAAAPLPVPAVVTIHDLSFEREPRGDEPARPARLQARRPAGGPRAPGA